MDIEWNIGLIVKKRAMLTPDKAAMIFEDNPITYQELNKRTNRMANLLQSKGIKKGDRVAVVLLNCPEFLEIYLASAKLGAIFVPLNFRLVGPELEYELNNCGAKLLCFHEAIIKNIDSIRNKLSIDADNYLFLKNFDSKNAICPDWAVDYDIIMKDENDKEPVSDKPVCMDDPLCIMYTSGVTGDPKGAVLTHGQTYFKNFQVIFYMDFLSDDIFLAQVPIFHSGGLFITSTPCLCRGVTFLMRQSFDPGKFAEDIEKYKATYVCGMTSMWKMIIQDGTIDKIDTSHVRIVVGGGEKTPTSLLDNLAARGMHLQMGYGQTENSFMMLLSKEDCERKRGSVGKPGFFSEIWIQDKKGNKLPPKEIGEIVAKGPVVMSQYWNMPEKTEEAIVDGILHTGDLGYIDEEGFFYLVDREKDMYRSGGENVYPAEVEKILMNHGNILDVAIIGVSDEKWGETGKAFIVTKDGETVPVEEVKAFLDGKIARYKYPSKFKFVESLPMTTTGKVKKAELKKKYGARLDK